LCDASALFEDALKDDPRPEMKASPFAGIDSVLAALGEDLGRGDGSGEGMDYFGRRYLLRECVQCACSRGKAQQEKQSPPSSRESQPAEEGSCRPEGRISIADPLAAALESPGGMAENQSVFPNPRRSVAFRAIPPPERREHALM
jgi:hypothetical protein